MMNRLVWMLFATALLVGLAYGMHGPVLPLFAKNEIGADYGDLGIIGMVNFLPYMIIPIFVGILLERINNGYMLIIGVLLNTISLFLTSIATTVTEIIIYRAMVGVAHAFIWPPSEAMLSDNEGSRVRNISWFTMFFVVGFMVGPLLGSVIIDTVGVEYRLLFQFTAYVMGAGLVSSAMTYSKAPKRDMGGINLRSFGHIIRFPVIVTLLLFSTAAFGLILTIYPAFLNDRGMDETSVLVLYFIFGITRVGSLLVANTLSRVAVPTIVASTILVTVGMGLSAVSTTFVEFAVALLLLGFGFSILYPLALEIILVGSKKSSSGRMIGAYEAIFGVGWTLGPSLGGYVIQLGDSSSVYLLFCYVGVAVSIMSIVFHRRLRLVASRRDTDDKS